MLGSIPTYYATARDLTKDNAEVVVRMAVEDGATLVDTIVAISEGGRAPKNDAALFALAIATSYGNDETRKLALAALPRVARIGTHLFQLVERRAVPGLGPWSAVLTSARGTPTEGTPMALAYQLFEVPPA